MLENQFGPTAASSDGASAPLLSVRDISYTKPGYRSFEFVSFEARAGQVVCVHAGNHVPVRDLLLAIAGAVRPTHGAIAFPRACGNKSRSSLRAPAALVGLGVFSGYCEVDAHRTVEESVRHERAACGGGRGRSAWDSLEFLASFGIATHADRWGSLEFLASFGIATHADRNVDLLEPPACARLSAALSHVGEPAVSVVDFSDAFCCGLTAGEAASLMADLRDVAAADGTCFVVGTCDPLLLRAADVPVSLDVAAGEASPLPHDAEVR